MVQVKGGKERCYHEQKKILSLVVFFHFSSSFLCSSYLFFSVCLFGLSVFVAISKCLNWCSLVVLDFTVHFNYLICGEKNAGKKKVENEMFRLTSECFKWTTNKPQSNGHVLWVKFEIEWQYRQNTTLFFFLLERYDFYLSIVQAFTIDFLQRTKRLSFPARDAESPSNCFLPFCCFVFFWLLI